MPLECEVEDRVEWFECEDELELNSKTLLRCIGACSVASLHGEREWRAST